MCTYYVTFEVLPNFNFSEKILILKLEPKFIYKSIYIGPGARIRIRNESGAGI